MEDKLLKIGKLNYISILLSWVINTLWMWIFTFAVFGKIYEYNQFPIWATVISELPVFGFPLYYIFCIVLSIKKRKTEDYWKFCLSSSIIALSCYILVFLLFFYLGTHF
jgi:hypothetical protein